MWGLHVGGQAQPPEVPQKILEFWADMPHLFSRHQPLWSGLMGWLGMLTRTTGA